MLSTVPTVDWALLSLGCILFHMLYIVPLPVYLGADFRGLADII